MFKALSNYFHRKIILMDIKLMLKVPENQSMSRLPSLCYDYHIENDVLTLIMPSKDSYLFSRLSEKLIITYNQTTKEVKFSNNPYNIIQSRIGKKLKRSLNKVFQDLKERDNFIKSVYEERKIMAKFIDPRHRENHYSSIENKHINKNSEKKRDKDGSVYRDIVYSASESSSSHDSSGSNSHGGSHSHHDT